MRLAPFPVRFALQAAALAAFTASPAAAQCDVSRVAVGGFHVIALRPDGTAWGWGDNTSGQLASPSSTEEIVPLSMPVGSAVTDVAAGIRHSLALDDQGRVWAWGSNSHGQLGNGTIGGYSSTITMVPGLPRAVRVACGTSSSFIIATDGSVWAWGDNLQGELADGTRVSRGTPAPCQGLPGPVTALSASSTHVLAVTGGQVWGWGSNGRRQLGQPSGARFLTAVQVTATSVTVAVAAGSQHSLALAADGSLEGWGSNQLGELGLGHTNSPVSGPTFIALGRPATAIAAGGALSLAVLDDGTVRAWGSNETGQLGNGSTRVYSDRPVSVLVPGPCAEVFARFDKAFALLEDGSLRAWGSNDLAELGVGSLGCISTPQGVALPPIVEIAAGGAFALARETGGTVHAWGYSTDGEIGQGTQVHASLPAAMPGVTAARLGAGWFESLLARTDASVDGCGWNATGSIDPGSASSEILSPSLVPDPAEPGGWLRNVARVAGGFTHSLAVKSDSTVVGWGSNYYGELGASNAGAGHIYPQLIGDPLDASGHITGALDVEAGEDFSVALLLDGTVRTFGAAASGQLGNGGTTASADPVPVPGLSGIVEISAFSRHVLALKSDGTVWAWGDNTDGQVGDGTLVDALSPVQVLGIPSARGVAAGSTHSLIVARDGSAWAWGGNDRGQLGDGTRTRRLAPVQVRDPADPSGFLTITDLASAGSSWSMVLKTDGTVKAWGSNLYGELGIGTFAHERLPVRPLISCTNLPLPDEATDLRVVKSSDDLLLTWTPAPAATSHEIYAGTLAQSGFVAYDHAPLADPGACSVTGASYTHAGAATSPGGAWFVVVGRNATGEGPYGRNSYGSSIPVASVTCP